MLANRPPAAAAAVPLFFLPWTASLAADLTFVAYFVVAECLLAFSTWSWVALEYFSRSRVLEVAEAQGRREQVEARLARAGTYELAVRITRFVANALMVIGIAFLVLRGHIGEAGSGEHPFPWTPLVATVGITFLVSFVLNDLLVRLLAQRKPDEFLVAAMPTLDALSLLTAPIRIPLALLVRLLFRIRLEEPVGTAREEVLESVEEGTREGSLTADEAGMIESIIDLDRATVDDIFTPRGEMAMLQADTLLTEAVAYVLEQGHRRLPVYGRDRDDVVGILHSFDLLGELARPRARERVKDIMRSPFFVPEGKPLNALLGELRARRTSLALVTNEFGGTAGLVTISDVLQEIVGEMEDEHDKAEAPPERVGDGALVVEGRTPIEDINETLSIELPQEDDFETIGGLVFHHLGKVPEAGEVVTVAGVTLTVEEADARTVRRVRVLPAPPSGEA